MKKKARITLLLTVFGLLGVCCYVSYASWAKPLKQPVESLPVMENCSTDLWPLTHTYAWRLNAIEPNKYIGMGMLTTEHKLAENETPTFSLVSKLPKEGDIFRPVGWAPAGGVALDGLLTCQVIDLQDIGLEGDGAKRPVRLFARFKLGASIQSISREKSILKGQMIGAIQPQTDPKWIDDELLLLVVYTQDQAALYAHHLYLKRTEVNP